MAGETDGDERKVELGRGGDRVARHVARGRAGVFGCVPRAPRLLLGDCARLLERIDPLLVALVRHACIGVAVVYKATDLSGQKGPERDARRAGRAVLES